MKRRNYSPEFKRESAQLVVEQNYTVSDAAKAMDWTDPVPVDDPALYFA